MDLKLKINQIYHLKSIESADEQLIQRLHDLGLYEGQPFQIINIISFKSVYVLRLNEALVALNSLEMSCLKV